MYNMYNVTENYILNKNKVQKCLNQIFLISKIATCSYSYDTDKTEYSEMY